MTPVDIFDFRPQVHLASRPSSGNRGLANVWDFNADYHFTRSFGTSFYYGHAWGKGVIEPIYPKESNGQYLYS